MFSRPRPERHYHVMRAILHETDMERIPNGHDQGFLTECGIFVRRKPAEHIARDAGQLKGGSMIGSVLTSEDLW